LNLLLTLDALTSVQHEQEQGQRLVLKNPTQDLENFASSSDTVAFLHQTYEKTDNLYDKGIPKRSVSFSEDEYYLIPNRDELIKEISRENLWYTSSNFTDFREAAKEEAIVFMAKTGILSFRKAWTHLYQPEYFTSQPINAYN
jgi:hypothetical protein